MLFTQISDQSGDRVRREHPAGAFDGVLNGLPGRGEGERGDRKPAPVDSRELRLVRQEGGQAVIADAHEQSEVRLLVGGLHQLLDETLAIGLMRRDVTEEILHLVDGRQHEDVLTIDVLAPWPAFQEFPYGEPGKTGGCFERRPGRQQREDVRVVPGKRGGRKRRTVGRPADRQNVGAHRIEQRQHARFDQRGLPDTGRPMQNSEPIGLPQIGDLLRLVRPSEEAPTVRTTEGARSDIR
ncbi:hypothetical protein J5X84_26765 [Streptosporangiaceae bacterium NEAU-GS5]|nr:hypothetical protein [Streptosporangiaceae bacterium NEAU-GS5]